MSAIWKNLYSLINTVLQREKHTWEYQIYQKCMIGELCARKRTASGRKKLKQFALYIKRYSPLFGFCLNFFMVDFSQFRFESKVHLACCKYIYLYLHTQTQSPLDLTHSILTAWRFFLWLFQSWKLFFQLKDLWGQYSVNFYTWSTKRTT